MQTQSEDNLYLEYIDNILDLEIKLHKHSLNKYYFICPFNDPISLYLEHIKTQKLVIGKDIEFNVLEQHINKFIEMYEDFIKEVSNANHDIPFSKNISKSSANSLRNFIKNKGSTIPKEQFKNSKESTKYRKDLRDLHNGLDTIDKVSKVTLTTKP